MNKDIYDLIDKIKEVCKKNDVDLQISTTSINFSAERYVEMKVICTK